MFRIFTLILTLLLSNTVFAGTTASSVRTDSGQVVSVGDSFTEMSSRINQSPVSMNSYETKYYTFHCTGMEAYKKLKSAMGDKISYLETGNSLIL